MVLFWQEKLVEASCIIPYRVLFPIEQFDTEMLFEKPIWTAEVALSMILFEILIWLLFAMINCPTSAVTLTKLVFFRYTSGFPLTRLEVVIVWLFHSGREGSNITTPLFTKELFVILVLVPPSQIPWPEVFIMVLLKMMFSFPNVQIE